ncbi:creatininase family protein [Pelagibius sp.]|uniref:creatininase family protein n=1 Tax=Pelagibius sp. TaxID=1931238 RepID=UPI0026338470|nr:creatininase family protein [Pelagibius sp.]
MKLAEMTWPEVEAYLRESPGIILPTGSTEQHGPIGLIGTDAICAQAMAERAAEAAGAIVAPVQALTPAQFNLAFPGTISLRARTFTALVYDVLASLAGQGFTRIYILNGHGANLAPIRAAIHDATQDLDAAFAVRLRSWWDYPETDALRRSLYGEWEGMHATPSEVAITQALVRAVTGAEAPPEALSADYLKAHAGDLHGDAADHRRRFPDGRVGSHSALASPEQGRALLDTAVREAAADYEAFLKEA